MAGYREALEAAGAKVEAFEEFGSYQGDWWAKTDKGWINGSYGSCSGCDAFQAEFGYSDTGECEEHEYREAPPDCAACVEAKAAYQVKLANFGREYVDAAMSYDKAIENVSRNLEWDSDAQKMLDFIKAHA